MPIYPLWALTIPLNDDFHVISKLQVKIDIISLTEKIHLWLTSRYGNNLESLVKYLNFKNALI